MTSEDRPENASETLSKGFAAASAPRKKAASPFCLRLTSGERARLQSEAGSQPLGAYIRDRLLGDRAIRRRRSRRPQVDERKLAQLLAELGASRLSANMNQLARAANIGALPVTPELEEDLQEACAAIAAMRALLIDALGVKSEGRS